MLTLKLKFQPTITSLQPVSTTIIPSLCFTNTLERYHTDTQPGTFH